MKKSQLHLRGPLKTWPNAPAGLALGWLHVPAPSLEAWVCVKAVNTMRLDVGALVARKELADLVALDPADITVLPPTTEHAQVYVDGPTWRALGGPEGPGDGERASERAMRVSAEKMEGSS